MSYNEYNKIVLLELLTTLACYGKVIYICLHDLICVKFDYYPTIIVPEVI